MRNKSLQKARRSEQQHYKVFPDSRNAWHCLFFVSIILQVSLHLSHCCKHPLREGVSGHCISFFIFHMVDTNTIKKKKIKLTASLSE